MAEHRLQSEKTTRALTTAVNQASQENTIAASTTEPDNSAGVFAHPEEVTVTSNTSFSWLVE
jgi:hypothetical protein